MIENIKNSFKETSKAIIPICIIITILSIILNIEPKLIKSFILSSTLLIIGISLFTFGADLSMIIIGEKIGNKLIKNNKKFIIILTTFIIGTLITIAEPDLRVLASEITSIPTNLLIPSVGIGVGIFLSIAALKIILKGNLKLILLISHILVFILFFFIPQSFIPMAFDSSGVTTGPISVPFILALGLGFAKISSSKDAKNNTFGLIGLCVIGPKLTVLLLGLLFGNNSAYDETIFENNMPIIIQYITKLIECFKEIFISLLPIILIFIIFKTIHKEMFNKKETKKIIIGLATTFIGLLLFLTSVNVGFMQTGFILGQKFIDYNAKIFLIPFGMILGYLVISAEPAVKILTEEVENATEGSLPKKLMLKVMAIGVALAILIALTRAITGISILYFLIPGYLIALLLMIKSPKMFTAIAFDAGGSVCGPLTATFILPLAIGACITAGGNITTDAFGLITLVALSPLIMIQILGIVFKYKTKQDMYKEIDEEIIDYDWRSTL